MIVKYENQFYPPSLSHLGKLRTGKKSDLLHCLEDVTGVSSCSSSPAVQVGILDGAAVVNMLQPGTAKTFDGCSKSAFIPYVTSQLQTLHRLDIIWDVYLPDSRKMETRNRRGKGVRRRVAPQSKIPSNWQEFLWIDENKNELLRFLLSHV